MDVKGMMGKKVNVAAKARWVDKVIQGILDRVDVKVNKDIKVIRVVVGKRVKMVV